MVPKVRRAGRLFDFPGVIILLCTATSLFILERHRPLRPAKAPPYRRIRVNSLIATTGLPLLRILVLPAMLRAVHFAQTRDYGIPLKYLPGPMRWAVGLLLLDYTNYGWHRLLHSPMLWRFHQVHHSDVDMDITTGFRFHFGEMLASLLYRPLTAGLSGASPKMVVAYEIIYEAATAFHHSNSRLPFAFEKLLNAFVVTPRMHGIHHSIIQLETNSNFSIVFSFWDRLHGTTRPSFASQPIIGVPSLADEKEQTLGFLLRLPFGRQRGWYK